MSGMEELADWARNVETSIVNAFADFHEAMQPQIDAANEVSRILYDAYYTQYLSAGAPYGETHEGLLRWVETRRVDSGGH